jgi:sulfur carrier protein
MNETRTVTINGKPVVLAAHTLADALAELGYGDARVATARGGDVVPAAARAACVLQDGDTVEILMPMRGG